MNREAREKSVYVDHYWDSRAHAFDNLSWVNDDILLSAIISSVGTKLPSVKILDIGTGTGKLLKGFHACFPGSDLTGIDICPTMLSKIDPGYGFRLLQRDVCDMWDVKSDMYDVVTARMVFHHLLEPHVALAEIHRVLRPGGTCIICEGIPPHESVCEWYTEMFKYKEDRITLTASDIESFFSETEYDNISTKIVTLKDMSILNWLKNASLDEDANRTIFKMHQDAPQHVKDAYNMKEENGDICMDWKFAIVRGVKQEK